MNKQPATRRETLLRLYERAERRLRGLIARQGSTAFQRARAEVLLKQIEEIVAELRAEQSTWLHQEARRVYRDAQEMAAIEMGQPLPTFSRISRRQVETLAAAAGRDAGEALASVVPNLGRVFHDTVQRVAAEQAIDSAIAQGVIEGLGSRELTKRIMSTLATGAKEQLKGHISAELAQRLAEVGEGRFITLTCRDGKVRRYSLKWYAETVARTMHSEARTEATLATMAEYGGDLVRMTFHDGACPLCVPFAGKVYSVSGRHPDFPELTPEKRTPIHPWCRHWLIPVSETKLRRRGQYEAMVAFSGRKGGVETWGAYQSAIGAERAAA